jgi:tetratricopeptide (TPR) repeat protein
MARTEQQVTVPKRVFVSYAHDSAAHEETVRELWLLLRRCGVDARLDKPAAERRQDWPLWMLEQVRSADYVLVIASPAYRRRAEGDATAGEGRGVQFEAALIREELYRNRQAGLERFLPVLLPGESVDDIPAFLGPTTATSYQVGELTPAGVERLLRVLTDQPWEVEPPLGPVPPLPPRPTGELAPPPPSPPQVALTHELLLDVALEGSQLSCRTLLVGTLLSERAGTVPFGLDTVWAGMASAPAAAEQRLVRAGHRLREALLDEDAVRQVTELLDHSALGTTVDVVIQADGPTLGLPYELLRLPDGRLLATLPGVRMRRRLKNVNRAATAPLPGPLKLLVAVAAPEETRTLNPPLDVEAEMQAILDAVGGVGGRSDAQVTILEVGGLREISEALKDDQYHVLHLSAHGSASGVELEDEDGNPVGVETAAFVAQLRAGGKPLPLLVLSSCAGGAGGSDALAATLIRHGGDRVLAMQTSVTDQYATQLARQFYNALADDAEAPVAGALAEARRRVEEDRLAAQRSGGTVLPPEYGVATLLSADNDPPLQDPIATAVPLDRPTPIPTGTGVRQLRIGDLIGRRPQLRTALIALRGGQIALDRFGALSGVLLTGIGGIGKTALAGRIQTRMAGDGWLTAVHVGRWNPPALSTAVAEALASNDQLANAHTALTDPGVDDTARLGIVCQLLRTEQLLLLFDDFEQNLTIGGTAYHDPGFAEVVNTLYEAADVGRLLVTSRHPLPDDDGSLLRLDLPPLSSSELGRLLLRLPALRELEPADRQVLVGTIGGHPRLIEFVNALLRQGRANLKEVTGKLRRLAGQHGIALTGSRPLTEAVKEAVLLGSRDIFLDELLSIISDEERELLLQAAVSFLPMTAEDLAVARWDGNPNADQRAIVAPATERLLDLTLLSTAGDEEFVVHPWLADALRPYQEDLVDQRHRRAITMRLARLTTGHGDFADLIEIANHQAATRQFDELVSFALTTSTIIATQLGELSVAAFLGQIVPMVPTDTKNFLALADRETDALLNTGNVSAAVDRATATTGIALERAEAEPSNSSAQGDLSVSYTRLGDVLMAAGNTSEAQRLYRDSLAIIQRVAQADPTNSSAQRNLSVSYNRLGDVLMAAGNTSEAQRLYRDSLAIRERLAEADPTNSSAQRDLAVSYTRLGDVLMAAGNTSEAERLYRDGLAIDKRLAEADPTNSSAQRDLSADYTMLGDLLMAAGNTSEAERLYRDSLAIDKRQAEADPTNSSAQRDLSIDYIKLGDVRMAAGNTSEAERLYRDSLAIHERLAEADPTNSSAQRDLSVSYERLGDLMVTAGNTSEAQQLYRNSLAIETVTGSNASAIQALRDKLQALDQT